MLIEDDEVGTSTVMSYYVTYFHLSQFYDNSTTKSITAK